MKILIVQISIIIWGIFNSYFKQLFCQKKCLFKNFGLKCQTWTDEEGIMSLKINKSTILVCCNMGVQEDIQYMKVFVYLFVCFTWLSFYHNYQGVRELSVNEHKTLELWTQLTTLHHVSRKLRLSIQTLKVLTSNLI